MIVVKDQLFCFKVKKFKRARRQTTVSDLKNYNFKNVVSNYGPINIRNVRNNKNLTKQNNEFSIFMYIFFFSFFSKFVTSIEDF